MNGPFERLRARRVALVALGVVLALELLYVIIINGVLASPLGPLVINNLSPAVFRLTFSRAWSLIPGRVHTDNLYIRIDDGRVQVQIRADTAQMDIYPLEMFHHVFTGKHVRAEGLSLRVRQFLDPKDATAAKLATLPDIDGRPEPPVRAPPDGLPFDIDKLYGVHLSDIDVRTIRELWVDEYRFVGDLDVLGEFYFKPLRAVRVDDATLAVKSGSVSLGGTLFADALHARLAVDMREFDLRSVDVGVLAGLRSTIELQAAVTDMAFLNYYLRRIPEIRLEEGAGDLALLLRIDRGTVLSGSTLALASKRLEVVFPLFTAVGAGRVDWHTDASRSTLVLAAGPFALVQRSEGKVVMRGKALTVRAHTAKLDFTRPIDLEAAVALPDMHADSLTFLNTYLPKGLGIQVLEGKGAVRAVFEIFSAKHLATGDVEIDGDRLSIKNRGTTISGRAQVHGTLRSLDLKTNETDLSGSELTLNDVSVVSRERQTQHYWAQVRAPLCKIHPRQPIVWETSLEVALKSLGPIIDVIAANLPVPWIVEHLAGPDTVQATTELEVGEKQLRVNNLSAAAGPLKLVGRLALNDIYNGTQPARKELSALMLVTLQGLSVGVDIVKDHPGVRLLGARAWYAEQGRK